MNGKWSWAAPVAAAGALLLPAPALAQWDAWDTMREIDAAISAEPMAANEVVADWGTLPDQGTDSVQLEGGVQMTMPATGTGADIGGTSIFEAAESPDAQIAVQQLEESGTRALVHIDEATAPERYSFELGGDVASLTKESDGSVTAYNGDGHEVGGFPQPWARDAEGNDVPTYYEVNGTSLTQVVEHQGGHYAYGITADPWWLPPVVVMSRCARSPLCSHMAQRDWGGAFRWALEHMF